MCYFFSAPTLMGVALAALRLPKDIIIVFVEQAQTGRWGWFNLEFDMYNIIKIYEVVIYSMRSVV